MSENIIFGKKAHFCQILQGIVSTYRTQISSTLFPVISLTGKFYPKNVDLFLLMSICVQKIKVRCQSSQENLKIKEYSNLIG